MKLVLWEAGGRRLRLARHCETTHRKANSEASRMMVGCFVSFDWRNVKSLP